MKTGVDENGRLDSYHRIVVHLYFSLKGIIMNLDNLTLGKEQMCAIIHEKEGCELDK